MNRKARDTLTVKQVLFSDPPFPFASCSIEVAQSILLQKIVNGADCPCCGQNVKVYARNISYAQIKALRIMYRLHLQSPGEYFHHRNFWTGHGNDYSKMALWGLIEIAPKPDNKDTRTSGMWRIREKGIKFMLSKISIPEYAWTFNGKFICFSGPAIYVQDCIKDFSYAELMGNEIVQ